MTFKPTEEQRQALIHVAECVITHHRHSLTSCPPNTRAMCDHYRVLKDLQDNHGIKVEFKGE